MARCLELGAMAVGMVFFTGVALINAGSCITARRTARRPLCPFCTTRSSPLLGYGWLGNPLFLAGLTGVALSSCGITQSGCRPRCLGRTGGRVLSWGRGIGSATGLYFLER